MTTYGSITFGPEFLRKVLTDYLSETVFDHAGLKLEVTRVERNPTGEGDSVTVYFRPMSPDADKAQIARAFGEPNYFTK